MRRSRKKSDDDCSRQELIATLEQFQLDLKNTASNRSAQLKALIGGASSLAMLSSFLLGRNSAKKRASKSDSKKGE